MTISVRPLRRLIWIQLLCGGLLAGLVTALADLQLGASCAVGALTMTFNLVLLSWSWWRLLSQKTIAWTVLIIVIKYAALLSSIFYLARTPWFSVLGAGLGISSFVMAILIFAILSHEKEKT